MCGTGGYDPADTDWNEVWKARMARHDATKNFHDPSHNWDNKENAERYYRSSQGEFDARVNQTIAGLKLSREYRVLDIGSGPGTLAIPLSPLVKEVTALDSSEGMLAILRDHADRAGIQNIRTVHGLWEEIDPVRDLAGPYDIIISSLALTMFDLKSALRKMNDACSGYVAVYWFADMPFWERNNAGLWEQLHGSPYYPSPKADCVFGVLCQMGLFPDVTMLPLDKTYRFGNLSEALAYFAPKFGVKTPQQEAILREYISRFIRADGNGVILSGDSLHAKIVWHARQGYSI
ncbi:MAG: class I SAM-dependent methyltransferase [Methanoregulaceae archaeon]